MRLTCKQVKDFVEIFLGDGALIKVHRLFLKSELAKWEIESKEAFFERFSLLEPKVCLQFALQKLSRRSFHSEVLKKQLVAALFSERAIADCVEELQRLGILDNADFVAYFVQKLKCQGKSERQILVKAHQMGLPMHAIKGHFGGEEEILRRLIEKKYPILLAKEATLLQKQKAMRALYTRGFSSDLITCAIKGE